MGLSIKFFSGWEICSSLMESSPKQSKEVFLSFLFFQSCQSICLQWFQEAASLLEAYIFTVYGLFSLPFHRKTSRSLRFLIWTSTSSVFVLSWKTKVFSSLFLFLSYSHATAARQTCSIRHWPFTCVPPPPPRISPFCFSFPWGEMKSILEQREAAPLFYAWMWRFPKPCKSQVLGEGGEK